MSKLKQSMSNKMSSNEAPGIVGELEGYFKKDDRGILTSEKMGYWSNLDKDENQALIDSLASMTPLEAIREKYPQFENVIFSPKRVAGLELLNLSGEEICMDFGCMWGALSIPLSSRVKYVVGVDQTYHSLAFLMARSASDQRHNLAVCHHDIKEMPLLENKLDVALVNGVMEWVPETQNVELKSFYGKHQKRSYKGHPGMQQLSFLERIHANLNDSGKLYLAIENRYDLSLLFGKKDPHADIRFTSILPRFLANIMSKIFLGRAYVTWIYSFGGLKKLIRRAGFKNVDLYMCFPDYRFPEQIFPYERKYLKDFVPKQYVSWKGKLFGLLQIVVFRKLKLKCFAPCTIAIASKDANAS